jgi:DNA polymerase alpha subunit B
VYSFIRFYFYSPTSKTHTKVVVVSSWREAGLLNVYPTPSVRTSVDHPNLFLAPDPCILDIDGFQIGVTSADVLMHLGKEELFG